MQDQPEPAGSPAADDIVELRSRIPPPAEGVRLLDYLLQRFRYHDRATWSQEIIAQRVLLNGKAVAPTARLHAGDALLYRKHHPEPPVCDEFELLHCDADCAVVEKPAHLPMHADGPFLRHTLIHLLQTKGGLEDARLVHRLDRETSGLVVIARNKIARRHLEQQFSAGSIAKEYLAVVEGQPEAEFACAAPIGHAANSAISLRRSAAADCRQPKPATTDFQVERRGPHRALVHCRPRTGRTHQIRVHLEACGFPIVGDKLYGHPDEHYLAFVRAVKAGADPRVDAAFAPSRQLLHAAGLSFTHPADTRAMRFASPLPAEFERWLLAP